MTKAPSMRVKSAERKRMSLLFSLADLPVPEKTSKPERRPVKVLEIPEVQLQAPLFIVKGVKGNHDSVLTDEQAEFLEQFADIPIFGLDDMLLKPNWSTEEILTLHSHLLESSLLALTGKGNGQQKQEILEWIFEPDYLGTVVRNGREVRVYTRDTMWTFAFCCRLENYRDPDVIRDFIRRLLPARCAMFH